MCLVTQASISKCFFVVATANPYDVQDELNDLFSTSSCSLHSQVKTVPEFRLPPPCASMGNLG